MIDGPLRWAYTARNRAYPMHFETLEREGTTSKKSATPSTKIPRVSAAVHKKVAAEMDAAFRKNVAKSKADWEQRRKKQETPMVENNDSTVILTESDQPEPVSTTPLEGLETKVLEVWLQAASARKAHQANPERVETAVRQAVFDALAAEAKYRAQGLNQQEAQEFTRPAMWLAPKFPTSFNGGTPPNTSTKVARVSDVEWAKVDAEMDAAFYRNIARDRVIRERRTVERVGGHGPAATQQPTLSGRPIPPRSATHGATNETSPTAERMARLHDERAALIADLKHFLADCGNVGVPHVQFLAGWDGVRLTRPKTP
jgi:hypothetical protein